MSGQIRRLERQFDRNEVDEPPAGAQEEVRDLQQGLEHVAELPRLQRHRAARACVSLAHRAMDDAQWPVVEGAIDRRLAHRLVSTQALGSGAHAVRRVGNDCVEHAAASPRVLLRVGVSSWMR